jgi:hypothetical protein
MKARKRWMPIAILALLPTLSSAAIQTGEGKPANLVNIGAAQAGEAALHSLAVSLRNQLIRSLPTTLYETSSNWGHTAKAAAGIKLGSRGERLNGELVRKERNDGTWRKVKITRDNLPSTFVLDLRNLKQPEPGRSTFDAFVSMKANVEFEQQVWKKGLRLYSGSSRARMRLNLLLNCEMTTHVQWDKLLPAADFRLRAVNSSLSYDEFVMEHLGGVGGDAAKVLGEAIRASLHKFRPGLERDLLAKADAAIVKAADTKEIRLGLSTLSSPKSPRPLPSGKPTNSSKSASH